MKRSYERSYSYSVDLVIRLYYGTYIKTRETSHKLDVVFYYDIAM